MANPSFSCRTLAPWEEVKWGFSTSAGLRLWLNDITGGGCDYSKLNGVREWMATAKVDDVAYLDDDFKIVDKEKGDIEIRCNRPVAV